MAKSIKILVACANGAGTSLMMKMTVEKVMKEMDISVQEIHHCALAEGKSCAGQYDLVFAPLNFVDMYKEAEKRGTVVIGLRNVLSEAEVKEKVSQTAFAAK